MEVKGISLIKKIRNYFIKNNTDFFFECVVTSLAYTVASGAHCVTSLARAVAGFAIALAGFEGAVASLVKFPHTSLARAVL